MLENNFLLQTKTPNMYGIVQIIINHGRGRLVVSALNIPGRQLTKFRNQYKLLKKLTDKLFLFTEKIEWFHRPEARQQLRGDGPGHDQPHIWGKEYCQSFINFCSCIHSYIYAYLTQFTAPQTNVHCLG